MQFTNSDKQQHGQSAQTGLDHILNNCKNMNYICDYSNPTKPFRIGKDGYHNSGQFYAPFLIIFSDGTKWVLFTTTSMRTDRIKGQQWDALNLKEIDCNIKRAYLIYSDGLSKDGKDEFKRQNDKYLYHDEFSAIDAIVSQNQIYDLIEEYALSILSLGKKKDRQGNNFEIHIAYVLSYYENLTKWKTKSEKIEGMHFDIFELIMNSFEIDPSNTRYISATADKQQIGKLPSGGNPKTDILVSVTDNNGMVTKHTISCKRSSNSSVSVHQYSADSFADVLNKEDVILRSLLNEFQTAGSLSGLGPEKCKILEETIEPYLDKLSMWVLGGFGGEGTQTQCAEYILIYDNNSERYSIHKTSDYYQILLTNGVLGNFGTIFQWTYASKQRGKSIQLKCKII